MNFKNRHKIFDDNGTFICEKLSEIKVNDIYENNGEYYRIYSKTIDAIKNVCSEYGLFHNPLKENDHSDFSKKIKKLIDLNAKILRPESFYLSNSYDLEFDQSTKIGVYRLKDPCNILKEFAYSNLNYHIFDKNDNLVKVINNNYIEGKYKMTKYNETIKARRMTFIADEYCYEHLNNK